MKLRTEYPIYLNPTFDEIIELAETKWDTVRIGVRDDNVEYRLGGTPIDKYTDIILGSGFGNTHETLVHFLRLHTGRKLASITPYILHHRNGIAYMNLEDMSGPQYARYDCWRKYFSAPVLTILKDLIKESDLAL